ELPVTGQRVQGKVRVALARREGVATLPIEKKAAWAPGGHFFSLPEVFKPSGTVISFQSRLRTIPSDPPGDTGGLALHPGSTFHLWLEHDTLPYRAHQLMIPYDAWRPVYNHGSPVIMPSGAAFEGFPSSNSTTTVDLTRSLKRSNYAHRFDPA